MSKYRAYLGTEAVAVEPTFTDSFGVERCDDCCEPAADCACICDRCGDRDDECACYEEATP